MHIKVDLLKSIEKGVLILVEPMWMRYMEYSLRFFIMVVLLVLPALFLSESLANDFHNNNFQFEIIIMGLAYCFVLYSIYKYNKMYQFKKVPGENKKKNREKTVAIAKKLDWQIVINNRDYMVALLEDTMITGKHQITVIYDESDVLINSFTTLRNGLKSPVSFWIDRSNVDFLVKGFKEI